MKKFWTYIKHKRKDIVGISSLKMDGKIQEFLNGIGCFLRED
jgi:hypothetical protein